MAQNQVYLIKSGENSFVEETQAIVGISGGKVGIGTTHPEADLHVTGSVKVGGDLTVDGTLTTINSSTVSVDDINIELGSTDNPTDATAEGGGITVKGDTDKTFNWHANGGWTSSENLSVADGKHFAGDELRALDAGGLSLFDTNQSGITIKGGKVGIHQAAPGYDLDVDGSGNFGSLYVDGNAVLTGEGSIFGKWEDGATQGEIFYTGGNVGVGTTNPEHNFHVVGNGVVDGNFVVNGTSGTFNVGEFDVSGSNITLNSAGGGLDSSRGGLIVNGDNGTGKLEYLDSTQTWQSNQDIQIVADKHLQTDKVRAIDDEGLYLQDDGGNGIYIQDGGNVNIAKQVNVVGLTKADGGLNVGNGKFNIQSDGTLGSVNPNADDVIKWDGTKWVAAVSPGGGGGGTSEVPNALINSLIAGESIQQITYGPYDSTPKIATDLEIVGDGSVIPYALSGVSETGYFAVFSQEIPNNNYKIHTVFGGKDVYWETGSSSSIYYNDGDVSLQRNLTVGGNLTVAGSTTSINTQTLEIKDHNLVIASNTGHNQLVDPYAGSHAGILWGTGDAGAASPVSLTYQSNKGFAFEGGKVGVGVVAPAADLHVFGSSSAKVIIEDDSDTEPTLEFRGNNASARISTVSDNDRGDNLIFKNRKDNGSLTDSLIITSAGNVGIGTTDPADELHINSTSSNVNLRLTRDTSTGGRISCSDGADTPAIIFETIASNTLSERMRIDSGGNVGIGTVNPDEMLTLTDKSSWVAQTNGPAIQFEGKTNNGTLYHFAKIKAISPAGGTNNAGQLGFYTTKAGVDVERVRIDEDGNVGIGTTNPKGKLELNNGTSAVELQFKETSTAWNRLGIRKEGSLLQLGEFDNNGDTFTSILAVDGNGDKVGIGITNPARLLHLKNSNSSIAFETPIDANGSAYAQIKSGRDGSSGYSSTLEFATTESTTAVGTFGSNGTGGSGFVTRMLIDSAGNVGIGTTSPSAKLQVDCQIGEHSLDTDNFNQVGLLVSGSATAGSGAKGGSIAFTNVSGGGGKHASITAVQTNNDSNNIGLAFEVHQGGTSEDPLIEAMRIDRNGNVGIGITDPGSYKLNVNGTAFFADTIRVDSTDYTSDDRVKHNEQPIIGALETLSKITPKKYIKTVEMYDANHDFELDADGNPVDSNGEPVEHRIEAGVIAQQVLTVDELAFAVSPEGVDEDGKVTSPHGLDYNSLFTYAIAAIQEQQQLIEQLKSQNESLAARISALES